MTTIPDPVAVCLATLRTAVADAGYPLSADGRVSESHAAALLGLAANTLRNWRATSAPIPWHRIGGAAGRVTYRLADLAEHIERVREETHLPKPAKTQLAQVGNVRHAGHMQRAHRAHR